MAMYVSAGEHGAEAWNAWEESEPMKVLEWVEEALHFSGTVDVLGYETFTISANTAKLTRGGSNDALDIIGGLKWLAYKHGIPIVSQSPSDAKSFMTDEKLRKLGQWTRGSDHARDATRHLARYLIFERIIDAHRVV
jgi:hypothetical protein